MTCPESWKSYPFLVWCIGQYHVLFFNSLGFLYHQHSCVDLCFRPIYFVFHFIVFLSPLCHNSRHSSWCCFMFLPLFLPCIIAHFCTWSFCSMHLLLVHWESKLFSALSTNSFILSIFLSPPFLILSHVVSLCDFPLCLICSHFCPPSLNFLCSSTHLFPTLCVNVLIVHYPSPHLTQFT